MLSFRLQKNKKVGMILASMYLSKQSANAWVPVPDYHKKILCNKTVLRKFVDYLDVGEPLPVCTDLILTFDYIDTARP